MGAGNNRFGNNGSTDILRFGYWMNRLESEMRTQNFIKSSIEMTLNRSFLLKI